MLAKPRGRPVQCGFRAGHQERHAGSDKVALGIRFGVPEAHHFAAVMDPLVLDGRGRRPHLGRGGALCFQAGQHVGQGEVPGPCTDHGMQFIGVLDPAVTLGKPRIRSQFRNQVQVGIFTSHHTSRYQSMKNTHISYIFRMVSGFLGG